MSLPPSRPCGGFVDVMCKGPDQAGAEQEQRAHSPEHMVKSLFLFLSWVSCGSFPGASRSLAPSLVEPGHLESLALSEVKNPSDS